MKYTLTLKSYTVNKLTNTIDTITEQHTATSVCSLFHLAGIKLNGKSKWEKAIIKNANNHIVFNIDKYRLLNINQSIGKVTKSFTF